MVEQGAAYTMERRDNRCSNWWLVVAVTMPLVVVIACMAVTFHMYNTITSQQLVSEDMDKVEDHRYIFIQFDAIGDISDNEILKFKYFTSNKVGLADNKEIDIFCNGPYILHMYVCSKGLDKHHGQGRLELRLAGTQTALTNLTVEGGGDVICKGLYTNVYLRRKEKATLHFSSEGQTLKIKNVTLGLHYLLGQCQF
ncbi:unnamed protein product [Lota lota]